MEVRCSVLERIVLSVAMLTVQSADRALMPGSIAVRAGTLLRTANKKKGQAGGNAQPRPNPQDAVVGEPSKKNRFYALKSRDKQENSAAVVTCMLQVFSTSVYAFLGRGYTLSSINPLLALTFEIFLEVLHDPLLVNKPLGQNVRTDKV